MIGKVVGENRQEVVLEERGREGEILVGLEQPGDEFGEERLLQGGVPETGLVNQAGLPGLYGGLEPDRDEKHLALAEAEQGNPLEDAAGFVPEADVGGVDVSEQFDGQSGIRLDDGGQFADIGIGAVRHLDEPGDGERQGRQGKCGWKRIEDGTPDGFFHKFRPFDVGHDGPPGND